MRGLKALVIGNDPESRKTMQELAERRKFEVSTASSVEDAVSRLNGDLYALALLDLELADGNGTELLDAIPDGTEVVVVTGNASVDTAVAALRGGAVDYLTKPVDASRLGRILNGIGRTAALQARVTELSRELRSLGRFDQIVGACPGMQRVYDLIERVAPTDTTVLVVGETGTGKEVVARALHRTSKRKDGPFLAVNCGAVAPNLMESELFGHEKGSFTGAEKLHRGVFERADGGTLLLDEVTEMPPELQVKLLRVLETMRVHRVGGDRPVAVDVRIVAATNRKPEEAIAAGKLREDLHYRLSVFPISIPPLRERGGDVRLLSEFFLERQNRRSERKKLMAPGAIELLERQSWPGNVRELANTIERAFIMAEQVIGAEDLPLAMSGSKEPENRKDGVEEGLTIAEVERRHILATLERLGGNKKKAAEILGVSLKTLYNRLKRYRNE